MAEGQRLPMLSVNGRKLIVTLNQLPRTWLTAEMLAQSVEVSRRTVLRELSGVEQWMNAAGFAFQRSPGQGILLDEGEQGRERLRQLLEESSADSFLPKRERQQKLLAALFAAKEPVKSYALAHDMMISERTLKNDLDQLEQWLQPCDIQLRRRPGVGVWLEGTPEKLRRGIGTLCQNSIPKEELQSLLQGILPEGGTLAALLDPAVTTGVLGIVKQFEREEQIHFTDSGFLSLTIHIVLTVQQLQNGILITAPSTEGKPDRMKQAVRLAQQLEKTFQLTIPLSEVQYLALYLDAYQPDTIRQRWDCPEEWHIRHLAMTLISGVEAVMNVDLSCYPTLADDLCCHLHPMFHRIAQGIYAENPQMKLIQEQYPQLWNATRTACDIAQEQLGVPAIPDQEAAFLAMHFGAIIEREALIKMRLRAVVVCHYGMASCRFLVSQLLRDFPVFHVSYSCSVRELNQQRLEQEGIDIVLSTIPLEMDFPCLCINPILQEQDKVRLRNAIEQLQSSQQASAQPKISRRKEQTLQYAGAVNGEMMELLETLRLETVSLPKNRAGLIRAASRLFCSLEKDRNIVEEKLWNRETLGDTYIKPLKALLLHCKTDTVSGCRLGYLKAEPPVYESGKMILGALVLLAPEQGNSIQMEIMQGVSALLIEEPKLIELLRSDNRQKAVLFLEQKLTERFQNKR